MKRCLCYHQNANTLSVKPCILTDLITKSASKHDGNTNLFYAMTLLIMTDSQTANFHNASFFLSKIDSVKNARNMTRMLILAYFEWRITECSLAFT